MVNVGNPSLKGELFALYFVNQKVKGKEFTLWPYLKRTTNYCSRECYWNSTRLKEIRLCKLCGKKFVATGSLIRKGFGIYCSRKCQFADYPKRVIRVCLQCNEKFEAQPARAGKRKFCSKKCRDDFRRDYVSRICRKCKKKFDLPRSDLNRGRGNFCTYRCYLTYRGPSTLEEKMKRALNLAGVKFKREVKFKSFHVDFLIEDNKSIIECDGEYWHLKPKIQERDKRKEKLLAGMGYKVLRFSGKTISKFSDNTLTTMVKETLYR